MIRINLLPFRAARQRENIRKQVSIFLLSLFCLATGLYYLTGYWSKQIDNLHQQINQTTLALNATQKDAKEVDLIKKELDALGQKTQVIEGLKKDRKAPVELLDAMTQMVIEKRMWFTSFSAMAKSVTIKGIAIDNKTVADFMTRLEESGIFPTVSLNSLKKQSVKDGIDLKSYEITCLKAITDTEAMNEAASK
ncbi:MAG: PilN domain-containing protein [Deltaproteobacteria bacterium]|nr:PilN domain-containing protein [Deltaproteobacteria bacterium]